MSTTIEKYNYSIEAINEDELTYEKNVNNEDENNVTDDDSGYDEYDDIYVITIDDKPYFYQTTLLDAQNKLLDVSRQISKKINETDYFDSYICQKEDSQITIVNQLDFILFTKHYVLHTLKIHRIIKY